MYPTSQAHIFLALYRTFLIVPNPFPPSCYIHQAHTPSPLWVICHAALVELSVCVYAPSAVLPACFNCTAFCHFLSCCILGHQILCSLITCLLLHSPLSSLHMWLHSPSPFYSSFLPVSSTNVCFGVVKFTLILSLSSVCTPSFPIF